MAQETTSKVKINQEESSNKIPVLELLNEINYLISQNNFPEAKTKLEKINENQLSQTEQLEFLNTKAELLSKTLYTEDLIEIREQIENILDEQVRKHQEQKIVLPNINKLDWTNNWASADILWEINITDIAQEVSHNVKKEVSYKIIDSLIERIILNKSEDNASEKNKETENINKMFFEEIKYLKNIWEDWEAYFYEYIYYKTHWNKQKEEEALKKSANEWNRDSINLYLENLENNFLNKYNSLNTSKEKQNYKQDNLLEFEKEYNKFIKWNFVNVKQKKFSPGNPDLHEDLWIFFEEINEPKRALQEYINWIKSQYKESYKLYWNIAELYLKNIFASLNKKQQYNLVHKKLINLISESKKHKDFISQINWYEWIWDLIKNRKRYWIELVPQKFDNWKISIIKNEEYYYTEAIKIFYQINLLTNEENINSFLRISTKNKIKYSEFELQRSPIENILLNTNLKNFLYLANYYEETKNHKAAIKKYILWYDFYRINLNNWVNLNVKDFENLSEWFILFLETELKKTLNNTNKKELIFLEKIIKKIKLKKELDSNDINLLFTNSLKKNFENNITFEDLSIYISWYNQEINNYNIYIQAVLKKLKANKNINTKLIEKLILKIQKQEIIYSNEFEEDLKIALWEYDNEVYKNEITDNSKLNISINSHFFSSLHNYLTNFELQKDNTSLDALLMFLQTTLTEKINDEINQIQTQNFELNNQINLIQEKIENNDDEKLIEPEINNLKYSIKINNWNIDFLETNKITLKNIIEIIDENKNITEEDIAFFFELTLDKNFYENLDFQTVNQYIGFYNQWIINADLYLKTILKQIEPKILKPYIDKIEINRKSNYEQFEELDIYDIQDLKDIIESSFWNLEKYKK